MAVRRRLRAPIEESMDGVPTRIDKADTVIPRRLVSLPRPTSSISQSTWERFYAPAEEWKVPPLFVNKSDKDTVASPSGSVKKESPKNVAVREAVVNWIFQFGYNRAWDQWLAIVSEPKKLTYAIEALWTKKYHSPVPDELVLVVDKHFQRGQVTAHLLSVFPKTDTAVQDLHRRYPGRAVLSLKRLPQSYFSIVAPIAGPASAEHLKASLQNGEVKVTHAVEANVAIRSAGTKKVITGHQSQLLWETFLDYVRKNAVMLVGSFSHIQSTLDHDAELLPDEIALTALRRGDYVHSIIPKPWQEADQLIDGYLAVYFERQSILRYVVTRIRGSYAMDVVEALFKGLGIFPKKPLPIELLLVAGILTAGSVKDVKAQPWDGYMKYIRTQGHGFWARMLTFYQATHKHSQDEDAPLPHLWLMFDRTLVKQNYSLERLVVSDREDKSAKAAIEIASVGDGTRLVSIRGVGALDFALSWLGGIGFEVQGSIEKSLLAGTWGIEVHWSDQRESPTWEDWRQYIQGHGAQGFFKRMRQVYEVVHFGEDSPDELVVLGRRRKKPHAVSIQNQRVLSVEEAEEYEHDLNAMKLRFRRMPDGQEVLVSASGVGSRESAALLVPQVGVIVAPDADNLEKQSQAVASYVSEKFGNLDEKLRKPEPLITPADVMPVPQLERPSDAVTLPQLGGFETTDPEAVKGFATPPSDKIPVIAAVSAMAMSVIAFFYGGAAMLRVPSLNPSFGSGSLLLSPRDRGGYDGT